MKTQSNKRPWFGKIKVKENPEAAAIWRARDIELEDCEPLGFAIEHKTDSVREHEIALGKEMWALAQDLCTPKGFKVLSLLYVHGCTLEEIARMMDLTRERIRQIRNISLNAIRMFVESKPDEYERPYWSRIPRPAQPVMAWELVAE